MEDVFDLKIENGDLVFGPDGEPGFLEGPDAVTQDVTHRVRESGLSVKMVANRGDHAATLRQIEQVAEIDERVEPGSMQSEGKNGNVAITGKTTNGTIITP